MDVDHGNFLPPAGGVTVREPGRCPLPLTSGPGRCRHGGGRPGSRRAGAAATALPGTGGNHSVDRDLASLWFGLSFTPVGWELPPVWDAIAGDYRCADGWIRLHTNAPHHRAAALKVLGLGGDADRETVAAAVERWAGEELEAAVVAANGCAALMRSQAQWLAHPQGSAVAAEPLIAWGAARVEPDNGGTDCPATAERPLAGVRVLDLTRIIAGPVATRFLAMYGGRGAADRSAGVGGGRAGGGADGGQALCPAGPENAGGTGRAATNCWPGPTSSSTATAPMRWTGWGSPKPSWPCATRGWSTWHWMPTAGAGRGHNRRGFDSLVQMSCGIAHTGMAHFAPEQPHPLPVQALDHATGYLCAAAAIDAWRDRLGGTVRNATTVTGQDGRGTHARRGPRIRRHRRLFWPSPGCRRKRRGGRGCGCRRPCRFPACHCAPSCRPAGSEAPSRPGSWSVLPALPRRACLNISTT